MREWRTGQFDRERVGPFLRHFAPVQAVHRLSDVDLDELRADGKSLILLDVDNTLVQWRGHEASDQVTNWLAKAKATGFDLCLISNTKRPARLAELSQRFDIPTVSGRFKPSRAMFRLALTKFLRKPSETVMVGDQLLTDVLGANRCGIDAIWVQRMEGPEFRGTKVSRMVEGLLKTQLYQALVLPEGHEPVNPSIGERTIVKQLARFVVVGGSSFVVDYLVKKVILFLFEDQIGPWAMATIPWIGQVPDTNQKAAYVVAAAVAAVVATYNSFVWNRKWTFEAVGNSPKSQQIVRFFTVAGVGALINIAVSTYVIQHIPPHNAVFISSAAGAFVGAIWNFIVQKSWTFRKTRP